MIPHQSIAKMITDSIGGEREREKAQKMMCLMTF